jgi:hypothetical protein
MHPIERDASAASVSLNDCKLIGSEKQTHVIFTQRAASA